MSEINKPKLGKLIGMKKQVFNQHIKDNQITLSKARLIPMYKPGDEMALTSVILAGLKFVKEFREDIFSTIGIGKSGQLYAYTEVSFEGYSDCRLDGLILLVKGGKISSAAIFEMKNGKNQLDKDQIVKYQRLAKDFKIPYFVTVSNQFVSDPSQSPIKTKPPKGVEMRHVSWSYLLTVAHLLLFKNDRNIADVDQKYLMKEIVSYLDHPKSGVLGLSQMSKSWSDIADKVQAKTLIKSSNQHLRNTCLDWQQEEKNLALNISRELGVLVTTGPKKYRGDLEQRIKDDSQSFLKVKSLESIFRISGAVSDIYSLADFSSRTIDFYVALTAPSDKTTKGKIGWLRSQLVSSQKKSGATFDKLASVINIEMVIKGGRIHPRFSINDLDKAVEELKSKEIKEFRILVVKGLGAKFASPKKFVIEYEQLMGRFYSAVIQHLKRWEASAPKVKEKSVSAEEEVFIDMISQKPPTNIYKLLPNDNNSYSTN